MIPVRVRMDVNPILATDRIIDLAPSHPLAKAGTICPACDGPLSGTKIVLVYIGIDPEERTRTLEEGWGTGGAVAVHSACAGKGE